jgi:hypothetical protein
MMTTTTIVNHRFVTRIGQRLALTLGWKKRLFFELAESLHI